MFCSKKKMCENCKNVQLAKKFQSLEEFFAAHDYAKGLIDGGEYEYDGGNIPDELAKQWPQDGLWYRIKCKTCGTVFTLWFDVFDNKGKLKKGK